MEGVVTAFGRTKAQMLHDAGAAPGYMEGFGMCMLTAEEIEERKLQMAMSVAPAWPVVAESGQPFTWAYGARELLAERKRVWEIETLRMKVEKPINVDHWGVPIGFQESFIDSHEARRTFMDKVQLYKETLWRRNVVKKSLDRFPFKNGTTDRAMLEWCATIKNSHTVATAVFPVILQSLLELQALCEELKPETLALARRCSSHEELEHSMLWAQ
jgi:hypothetical protein